MSAAPRRAGSRHQRSASSAASVGSWRERCPSARARRCRHDLQLKLRSPSRAGEQVSTVEIGDAPTATIRSPCWRRLSTPGSRGDARTSRRGAPRGRPRAAACAPPWAARCTERDVVAPLGGGQAAMRALVSASVAMARRIRRQRVALTPTSFPSRRAAALRRPRGQGAVWPGRPVAGARRQNPARRKRVPHGSRGHDGRSMPRSRPEHDGGARGCRPQDRDPTRGRGRSRRRLHVAALNTPR